MDIAVFGATGMMGSAITAEALRRGHAVTAISRHAVHIPGESAAAVLAADLADSDAVSRIAAGHDVVVLATVPSRTGGDHRQWLDDMTAALRAVGHTRVIIVGGAGALTVNGARLVESPDFPEAYRPEALTMAALYDAVKDAPPSLNWTMQAPAPQVAPGERTGSYRTADDSPAGERISSQDFAVALLDEIETPAHARARYAVAN
ncbi:MAG: NAD(P)H-binding protein [Actinomycetota bacterium]|nr:NAD(P)H-binding protein [Actinomycetota bacterium]